MQLHHHRGAGTSLSKMINKNNKIFPARITSITSIAPSEIELLWTPIVPFDEAVEDSNTVIRELMQRVINRVVKTSQANDNRIENRTQSPLISLPDLVIMNIYSHLRDQIVDDSGQLKQVCHDLRKFSKFENIETRVLEKADLVESIEKFLLSNECIALFVLLVQNDIWLATEWSIVLNIQTHLQKYLLIIPLCITPGYGVISLDYGDARELYKREYPGSQTTSEFVREFLRQCVDIAADYVMENLKVDNKNDIVLKTNFTSTNTQTTQYKISHVFSIFDTDASGDVFANVKNRFSRINEPSKHNVNQLNQYSDNTLRQVPHTITLDSIDRSAYINRALIPDDKINSGIISFYRLMITWYGKSDKAKVVFIKRESGTTSTGGGKRLKTPVFLEKRIVEGRERNVYKLGNKHYVKVKGNSFMGLKDYLKRKND